MEWLYQFLQLHLFDAKFEEPFQEEWHNDGGASALHLAATLDCPRTMNFVGDDQTLGLDNARGTVYTGGMVGCKHQVSHPPRVKEQALLRINGHPVYVSLQARCNIFNYDKARGKSHSPTPASTFHKVMEIITAWQGRCTLKLPPLSLCEAQLAELETALACEKSTLRKRPASSM